MWWVVPYGVSYKDREWLEAKYWDERLSAADIAEEAGCSDETVLRYMREFDIPRRGMSEAVSIGKRREHGETVPLRTHERGYEYWRGKHKGEDMGRVSVHRLAAVAWFGLDAVEGRVIHHKNNIPFDNREENLEPMEWGEHMSHHENWTESPLQDW